METRRPFEVALVDYDEDLYEPRGWEGELLAEVGANWTVGQHRTLEGALKAAQGAEVVMVQSVRPLLVREVIEQLEACWCIIRVGIGYDSVDVASATEQGIIVCNVPEYCVEEVADHALALLLAASRHLARQDRWIREGRWDRTGIKPAWRLRGSVLGLVAFGRTARALATKVLGLGLEVLAFDRYVEEDVADSYGVTLVELDELLRRSDLISVHAPLTEATRHLLGEREFELMKPGAVLVNTSRGPIVDEKALVRAVRDGRLLGAGLDVLEREPLPPDSPLLELDNVIVTPHVAGYSEESVGDLYRGACEIAIDVLQGRWPTSAVNPEARGRSRMEAST
jgi:D-3-phosphoglycerate dehydrogenase